MLRVLMLGPDYEPPYQTARPPWCVSSRSGRAPSPAHIRSLAVSNAPAAFLDVIGGEEVSLLSPGTRSATRQTFHDRGERLHHRLQNDDVGEAVALATFLERLHDLVDAADQDHRRVEHILCRDGKVRGQPL